MASTRKEDVGVLKFVTFKLDLFFFLVDGEGGRRAKKRSLCVDGTNIWPLGCNIARNHVPNGASSKTLTNGPKAADRIRSTEGATDHTRSTADHTSALEKKRSRITA